MDTYKTSGIFGKGFSKSRHQFSIQDASGGASAGSSNDPYWANVTALIKGDGVNGSTTITSSKGTDAWIAYLDCALSNAQVKWGTTSLYTGASGTAYITNDVADGFNFGTGDFTIEGWCYAPNPVNKCVFYFLGGGGGTTTDIWMVDGNVKINASTPTLIACSPPANTWFHFAISRVSGTVRAFLNGTMTGSASFAGNISGAYFVELGLFAPSSTLPLNGYFQDFRVTKGVGRYGAGGYTVPTTWYPTS
jgi:hypothetical protein